jgi:predicted Zn finger-like uncharacterized protein
MRFTCKKCKTPYTIADEKVRGKVIKVRCKRCNHLIVVRSSSPAPSVPAAPVGGQDVLRDSSLEMEFESAFKDIYDSGLGDPPPEPQADGPGDQEELEWYYGLDGSEFGPLSLQEMRRKLKRGVITGEHFVWREGMNDWMPVEDVPELRPARSSKAPPKPPPPAARKTAQADQARARQLEREREDAILKRKRAEEKKRREAEERRRLEAERVRRQREEEAARRLQEEKEKKRQALEEFKRRKEEEDRKLREKQAALRREEERRKKREAEAARQKEEQEQKEQEAQAARQKEVQEQKEREAQAARQKEEQEQKEQEAQAARQKEEQEQKEQEAQSAREKEEQEQKEQEAQAARQKEERERKKKEVEAVLKKEQEDRKKREEEAAKIQKVEQERGRHDMVAKVLKKRDTVRADRHADRIAEHFFTEDGKEITGDELLPPPPVQEVDDLADRLREQSVQEEYEKMQGDPLSVLMERDQPGKGEISKVSKVLAEQAGVTAKGRRLGVTLICLLGLVGLVGGVAYLAVTQGWFTGIGSNRLVDSVEKSRPGQVANNESTNPGENLSPEETRRLRSSLWDIEKKDQPNQVIASGGRPMPVIEPSDVPAPLTKREKELMAFYESQDGEKREVAPRGPRMGPVAMMPAHIEMPGMSTMPELSMREKTSEVVPTGPDKKMGPQKLSELQVTRVIQRHYNQVKSCLERQLKRDASISGKMYVVARLRPDGKVQKVHIATTKFHGTFVEECLVKEINRWVFPAFRGDTYEITFPLLLSARQSY